MVRHSASCYIRTNKSVHTLGGDFLEKVLYKREQGVSFITFNRPSHYNALDVESLEKLLHIIKEVEKNEDKIVVVSGEGKVFSAGGDVTMMGNCHDKKLFNKLMDMINEITLKLYMLPKIVIASVQGSAVGLGLSIALNSDFIVAHKEAKLGMLFAGIGLIPDGGGHFFLQERLGTHHAKQFIWGLEQIHGEQASKLGLVDIVSEGDVNEDTMQLIKKLQFSPLKAILKSKMIYHEQQRDDLIDYLYSEKSAQLEMSQTKDHAEGVKAFLEKRKPQFEGK